MKRTLTLLTLLLALLALLVLPAAAADLPRLVDNADLLMADDAEALLADLDSRSEALQFDIVIVTVDSLDGETPRNYAEDFFWYNNYGLGEDRDGALLLVAMDTRDWYIATHGFGITAITPAGREAMVDRFLPQLSNAEYAAAFPHSRRNVRIMSTKRETAPPTTRGTCPTSRLRCRASCGSWPACCSARSSAASRSA